MKTKVPVINNKSYMIVDQKGNKDIFINCPKCGKPITKTSVDFGMDCEDDCGRKAYEQRLKTDPKARAMDSFMKALQPENNTSDDDTKEEAFGKFFSLFTNLEKELSK